MRKLFSGKILLLIAFCLISSFSLHSAEPNMSFRGLTMSEGLSDLTVTAIYKDTDGFVWFGTDNSLDRFDGITCTNFGFDHPNQKLSRVNAITAGGDRAMWVGNGQGLWKLDNPDRALVQVAPSTIDVTVYSLLYCGNDTLYAGTVKGLFRYHQGRFEHILTDKNVFAPSNKIRAIVAGNDGFIWLATQGGIIRYAPATGDMTHFRNDAGPNDFRQATLLDETLYLGTAGDGLILFSCREGIFRKGPEVGSNIISTLSTDGRDVIYAGTDGNGVHFLSHAAGGKRIGSLVHNVANAGSIRSNSVYSFLSDREGIVWIGYYQGGVDYTLFQSGLFEVYAFPPLFDSHGLTVRCFAQSGQHKLIGSREGLYYINQQTKQFRAFRKQELGSNLILSVCEWKGSFYVGTYGGGIWRLNPQTLEVTRLKAGSTVLEKGHIFCFNEDAAGNLWIGTSGGVFRLDAANGQTTHYDSKNSQLIEGNVYEIFFDSTHKGWICTEDGICLFDPSSQTIKSNVFPEGFIHRERIRCVFEDRDQNLYFLPEKGDLFLSNLSMTRYSRLSLKNVVYGNAFMSIVQDERGFIWLAGDGGLVRLNPANESFSMFGFHDGLPSQIFTNGAAYMDADGGLWFGNSKGLVYLDPEKMQTAIRHPYPLEFTAFEVNGKRVESHPDAAGMPEKLVTEGNDNNLNIRFTPLTYTPLSGMLFEYMLEGHDKEWILLSGSNLVSYYNLPVGSYRFRVRFAGNEQTEISREIQIAYTPVWEFALVGLLIGALGLWFVVRRRAKRRGKAVAPAAVVVVADPVVSAPKPVIAEPAHPREESGKYKAGRPEKEDCEQLSRQLHAYMENEAPYMDSDLKIGDLAGALGTTSHTLSYLFNQHLNITYYDYVNEYRIDKFKRLANDSNYSKYTLSALAELSGFSSRASFFRSFKKSTGMTPNEYIQKL